jgi:hypothetical protein
MSGITSARLCYWDTIKAEEPNSRIHCRYCSFKAKVNSVTFNYKYLRYNLSDILNKTLAQAFTLALTWRCLLYMYVKYKSNFHNKIVSSKYFLHLKLNIYFFILIFTNKKVKQTYELSEILTYKRAKNRLLNFRHWEYSIDFNLISQSPLTSLMLIGQANWNLQMLFTNISTIYP